MYEYNVQYTIQCRNFHPQKRDKTNDKVQRTQQIGKWLDLGMNNGPMQVLEVFFFTISMFVILSLGSKEISSSAAAW